MKEIHYDNLEDELIAFQMDRLSSIMGEHLLEVNEQLKADPKYAVPEEVLDRMIAFIHDEFDKKRRP